ncbi:MAG: 5-methyltetrahydrofolate--homocysteine methyltransferase [Prevotella sp.]|nr:5-methyltetrahydrofolate--homocysteine methyltransferase [Prevotella sp.]
MRRTYEIHDLQPYINWAYFYYAWQLRTPDQQQQSRAEAEQMLSQLDGKYHAYALFQLFEAHSEGDDIILSSPSMQQPCRCPFLRQQEAGSEHLCLSDFIHPQHDHIGVFATSVDHGLETDFDRDTYQKMMVQLLADRLAEAAAERLHEEVRKEIWGYAPDEHLTMGELHAEKFQGIRPAVGYPSLPDTSLNFVLDKLLEFRQIGIRLTEHGAMKPHASVSGLMMALPAAHYFSIGKIGEDQLQDYARRRGLPVEVLRKYLLANL